MRVDGWVLLAALCTARARPHCPSSVSGTYDKVPKGAEVTSVAQWEASLSSTARVSACPGDECVRVLWSGLCAQENYPASFHINDWKAEWVEIISKIFKAAGEYNILQKYQSPLSKLEIGFSYIITRLQIKIIICHT